MVLFGQWLCSLVAYEVSQMTNHCTWRVVLLTQLAPPVLSLIFWNHNTARVPS